MQSKTKAGWLHDVQEEGRMVTGRAKLRQAGYMKSKRKTGWLHEEQDEGRLVT